MGAGWGGNRERGTQINDQPAADAWAIFAEGDRPPRDGIPSGLPLRRGRRVWRSEWEEGAACSEKHGVPEEVGQAQAGPCSDGPAL